MHARNALSPTAHTHTHTHAQVPPRCAIASRTAQLPHLRHAAAAEALSSEELGAYLGGAELKAVQGRCRALLEALAARQAGRPPGGGGSQQLQGGGGEDAWARAAAEADVQEQLEDARSVLQEQEKVRAGG